MDIIRCNTNLMDLAVNAMVTIKCTEDGLHDKLAIYEIVLLDLSSVTPTFTGRKVELKNLSFT